MTYEIKNITFHMIHVKVSSKSQCSRTLPLNVGIKSAQCYCGCEKFMQRFGLVEDVWKARSNRIKGKALYKGLILKLLDLFRAKCAYSTRKKERDTHAPTKNRKKCWITTNTIFYLSFYSYVCFLSSLAHFIGCIESFLQSSCTSHFVVSRKIVIQLYSSHGRLLCFLLQQNYL